MGFLTRTTLATLPFEWTSTFCPPVLSTNTSSSPDRVCLWMAVTYSTVIVYETVKCWEASGKSIRDALLGEPLSGG